jgi:hypothetical protein
MHIKFGTQFNIHTLVPVSLSQLKSGRPVSVYSCFLKLLTDSSEEAHALSELLFLSKGTRLTNEILPIRVDYLMWLLASDQWQSNLEYLQDEFRSRRQKALLQPGMQTYSPLIHLRQLIVDMRDHIPGARKHIWSLDWNFRYYLIRYRFTPSTLSTTLKNMVEDLNTLDKELNDEIHLIIGAVTVQDSDANKQQSERATLLTLLAAVYLPLTLVTGIFGMNIKDIDVGKPGWRACAIALAVVGTCTALFVLGYRRWRVWRRAQQERERMELGFDKFV